MNQHALGWDELSQLFSAVLCLDDSGHIMFASETLHRYVPQLADAPAFFAVFETLRPSGMRSLEDLRRQKGSLILLKTRDDTFAARGQFVEAVRDGEKRLCFCGAPWLFWMNTNCPDTRLSMGDFSAQDSQLDQLFLMTTEQRMVSDLEKLNAALKQAKTEAEEAQATKNALFARMSHEMRTPLNGVVSALALLGDRSLDEEALRLLNLAHSASKNLLHVINYVLDISKIEAGDAPIEARAFRLPRLLESVTDIVRARADEKGLALDWHTSFQLNDTYIGDMTRLRQCLLNLATNAIKFTSQGNVVVRAMPSHRDRDDLIRFEIEDTGIGISPENQKHIFDPFWTASRNEESAEIGTGLGLDIVRRHIDALGGSIGVMSREGKGSLFWFEVPLEAGDDSLDTEDTPTDIAAVPERFSGTVLLVDDNPTNLLLGRMILESLGVAVDEARDGVSAAEMALTGDFDLVLMDISMPVMDGVEATRTIREKYGPGEKPIVALTAYASSEERERCLAAGMNDYLTKPIVRDRLAEQLQRWLPAAAGASDIKTASPIVTPQQSDTPALAESVLLELREQIGEANLSTVLDQFEGEVNARWEGYADACEQRDRKAMIRETHTLASTCRSLGLIAAGEHFSALEDRLRADGSLPEGVADSGALLQAGLRGLAEFRRNH